MPIAVNGQKECPKCGETKPVEEFPRNSRNKDGRYSYCKSCHSRSGREWAKRNPAKHNARSVAWRRKNPERYREIARFGNKKKLYGVTFEQYNAMLESQGGVCAVCERPETRTRQGVIHDLSIDHDHETGAVRGLLCGACNTALGHAGDSPERLRQLLTYLEGGPK